MLKKLAMCGAVLVTSLFITGSAQASTIVQDTSNTAFQINFFEPIGQSFTAIDNALNAIGFKFGVINSGSSETDPVKLDLYQGVGTGGLLLASRTIALPSNANAGTFTDFDFGGLATVIGQQYSAALSIVGTSPRFSLQARTDTNSYSGGALFSSSPSFGNCDINCDAQFRVIGETVAVVPEPAAWVMMILGFGGVGAAMRLRRGKVQTTVALA